MLVSILRDGWQPDLGSRLPGDLIDEADRHGVGPLIAEQLRRSGYSDAAPDLLGHARRMAAADLVREAELLRLFAAFEQAGVPVLIFKGGQLAYTVYERPDLRPRLDSDLLFRPADRAAAARVLTSLGYAEAGQFTGDLVTYQSTYTIRRQGTVAHVVDLHWRLANPQQFGRMLEVDELFAGSTSVPPLGRHARAPGLVHALFIACIHPHAHHGGAEWLIWSWDIQLLSRALSADEWSRFADLALDRDAASQCHRSLSLARDRFAAPVPDDVMRRLAAAEGREAAPLKTRRRHIQIVWSDFRTLAWPDRFRMAVQHLFPPSQYMRDVYAPDSAAPLPVLYAQRMVRGAVKWLART